MEEEARHRQEEHEGTVSDEAGGHDAEHERA